MTIYQPGEQSGNDNSNIAIIGFSWQHGVRIWTTLVGNLNYTDMFARMDVFQNDLIVFLNSFSTEYSTNSSQTDIYYYRLRSANGFIQAQKIFGSPQTDLLLDLQVTFGGVYLLAYINDQFLPHLYNDKIWATQNSEPNIVVMWMDFQDNILDIEGYDITQTPFDYMTYPSKFFVVRQNDIDQRFVFVSSRTNSPISKNQGLFITYFESPQNLFRQSILCESTCQQCNPQLTTQCVICKANTFLFQQKCTPKQCPDFSYQAYDEHNNLFTYCKSCHYSCLTCSGSKKYQCQSCCMNDYCGSIQNRVPSLGQCLCSPGLVDANGICEQRCILNLKGLRKNMCYTQCPDNSYPFIDYGQPLQAQTRSQYDTTSQTNCEISSNHLQFSLNGKGLALSGPADLDGLPTELTISFWVRPLALNSVSYFVNAFNRVQVYAMSSNNQLYFNYKTSTTTQIQPIYNVLAPQRSISLNSWNYISVAVRQYVNVNQLKYELQMAISNSNMGTVFNSAYDNSQNVIYNPYFYNTIYVGSLSDITPLSFYGYLKEVKIFTKYHSFYQMQDEQLRMYRYYSYDDYNLVGYWKFNETYQQTDIEYTIWDYSYNQNSLTYSTISNPDYPIYIYNNLISLSLCYFHDVAICQSLDYENTYSMVMAGKRLTQQPTFQLNDFSYTKQDGDQVWFIPNNTQCLRSNIQAYMTYRSFYTNDFQIEDLTLNPVDLEDGVHYQVCYYMISTNTSFNLFQIHLNGMPETIDPSSRTGFITTGVQRQWMSLEGDQGYGDILQLSVNCDYPQITDFQMMRSNKPDYGQHLMSEFQKAGFYLFCWQNVYTQETPYPYFESVHGLQFTIVSTPTISIDSVSSVNANENMVTFKLNGAFADGDLLAFAWPGQTASDCNPLNFLGQTYMYNYSYWPGVWFGINSGIFGVKNYTMDELQLCYQSAAEGAPNSWARLQKSTGGLYFIKVNQYLQVSNTKVPELYSFNPVYGATSLAESDTTISFTFLSQAVYPAFGPSINGQIYIYRGALQEDGSIIKTNQILWSNTILNDFHAPNPFQQGNLMCSNQGQCNIILQQQANMMKAGEIYYLSFFPYSFAAKPNAMSGTKYYLFDDLISPIPPYQSVYDHLFFCRSFDITPSTQMINGRTLIVNGKDLLYKSIRQTEYLGGINTDIYYTKSINLRLTVYNTLSTFCTFNPPTATLERSNLQQTQFMIDNLDLRECNEGDLFADIELVRGIRNQHGDYTYIRSEKLKNIQLGAIGCDQSCLQCNGTTSQDCIICAVTNGSNTPIMYRFMGQCLASCPLQAPYFNTNYKMIYQSQNYIQNECVKQCPFGMYADKLTNKCLQCNPDCQTCSSNYIASCLSCNPVKYLFKGMCLETCPSPNYINNLDNYTCTQIMTSTYLSVKIQSLGYSSRVPKNVQAYLKAYINNDNGGIIVQITWTQLEPPLTSDLVNIFSADDQGNYITNEAIIKIKMTAFNYMASNQVVKVMCTVVNSVGDIANDVYEFYINSPPITGSNNLTVFDKYGNNMILVSNGTVPYQQYKITLNNWVFNGLTQNYKLSMRIDQVYYLVSDSLQSNIVYFRIPPVSRSETIKNISLCVSGIDEYAGEFITCQVVYNVQNDLNVIQNITVLISFLQSLNYTNNITNVILASQILYFGINYPTRLSSQAGICTIDFHCSYHGQCDSKIGIQRCICDIGYTGSLCQFQGLQLYYLKAITHSMISTVFTTITNRFEIKAFDIELLGTLLRGITKDPDIISTLDLELCIQLVELIAGASIYAYATVSTEIRYIYLDGISGLILSMFHSQQVYRSEPQTQELTLYNTGNRILSSQIVNFNQKQSLIGGNSGRLVNDRRNLQAMQSGQNQITQQLIYQQQARRLDQSLISFIENSLTKLNPSTQSFIYSTIAFSISCKSDYAQNIKTMQEVFIKENDVYWYIPRSIFNNAQGQASDVQEIRLLLMKYLYNPFLFEQQSGGYVESNVTTMSFYNTNNDHIQINFTNNEFINVNNPWNKSQGYELELLRCMSWNESNYSFIDDNSCTFSLIYDNMPCLSCAEGEYINTSVALCRCSHLSRIAAVYQQSVPSLGVGVSAGIYSNFFAMLYWKESFGFNAVVGCAAVFLIGHLFIFFIDRKLKQNVLEKLKENVRQMELRGFKQRANDFDYLQNHSSILSTIQSLFSKKVQKAKLNKNDNELVSQVVQLKEQSQKELDEELKEGPQFQNVSMKLQKKSLGKKIGKGNRSSLLPLKQSQQNKVQKDLNESQKNFNLFDDQKSKLSPNKDMVDVKTIDKTNFQEIVEEEKQSDEQIEKQMVERYEAEQLKLQEQKAVAGEKKKDDNDEDSDDTTGWSKEQKKYVSKQKKLEETDWYRLSNMIVHGNYFTSLIFVTSILNPRHVRWTLFYSCLCFNWFWCAVIFNNTKNPLTIPNFHKSSYQLSTSDLWVSIVSPLGTIILMYVAAGLLKVSDKRLKCSYTSIYLELMLKELKKEMRLRYILAYFILVCIYAGIFWYIIKFTATFGWKTSWTWFFSGFYATALQFCIYDTIFNIIHWVTHRCSRHLALFVMKIRIMKQAKCEI